MVMRFRFRSSRRYSAYSLFLLLIFCLVWYDRSSKKDHPVGIELGYSGWNAQGSVKRRHDSYLSDTISTDERDEEMNAPDQLDFLSNGNLFWDAETEMALSNAASKASRRCEKFDEKVANVPVATLTRSSWDHCGREGNAFGVFSNDSGRFCVRYRHPHDYLVIDEYLSFRLALLLGITTIPCVTLGDTANGTGNDTRWPTNMSQFKWRPGKPVAFIEWMEGFRGGIKLPNILLEALNSSRVIRKKSVSTLPVQERLLIAQLSDMIIFDYLIGHHDRFARLQDDSEYQHDPSILESPIPNLAIDQHGLLWFYDNEAGLLDGYSLMYDHNNLNGKRFIQFQDIMLDTCCVFRKQTVINLFKIHEATKKDPLKPLSDVIRRARYPVLDTSYRYETKWKYVRMHFRDRIGKIIDKVRRCFTDS